MVPGLSSEDVFPMRSLRAEASSVLAAAAASGGPTSEGFESTLALRITAIFVVASVSALGCLLAIVVGCNEEANNLSHRLLKCLAAGVIGAVGFVHVLPEAAEMLEHVTGDFPLAHVVALAGALLVVMINQVVDSVIARMRRARLKKRLQQRQQQQQQQRMVQGAAAHGGASSSWRAQGEAPSSSSSSSATAAVVMAAAKTLQALVDHEEKQQQQAGGQLPPALHITMTNTTSPGAHHHPSPRGDAAAKAMQQPQVGGASSVDPSPCATPRDDSDRIVYGFRRAPLLVAYVMELGIVFHSVLIGLGLGVLVGSKAQARSLLVAICFHQFFEGAGLSACLLEARLSRARTAAMVGLFSATTPLGIGLGIALSASYDPASLAAALVQGLLNAIAAGILIWLSLVEMVAQEFDRPDVRGRPRLQAAMFATTLAGAAIMSVLAIFE